MKNDLSAEHLRQEVTVTLPLSAILRLSDPAPAPQVAAPVPAHFGNLPAIGAQFQSGIYAGLSIENERPVALVLLPGEETLSWGEAVAWAEKQDGVLPSRIDQLVLFKNLKAEFKEAWYWSGEQFAGVGDYAWFQSFSNGYQNYDHKGFRCRARAVRRLPIQ